jgi:N-acetylglucosaminyldiphosphoundecaprenol N-acetyl-beta-D-mannosaminyltransferase
MDRIDVLGVQVDVVGAPELEETIAACVRGRKKAVIAYANVHAVNLAGMDGRFLKFLNSAFVTYCDGQGVRLGARILGKQVPPSTVLTRWVWRLMEFCQQNGFSVFLLGGNTDASAMAGRTLRERFPTLNIAGIHHGFFGKQGRDSQIVVEEINRTHPDLLFVGFGMPDQEFWIEENLHQLQAHVILPAGSMIDFVAGSKRAAPEWIARLGMEWFYRLLQEPARLWKRYVIGNPLFVMRTIVARLGGRK